MADSSTTSYSFTLPEVGSSEDTWGGKLNTNWENLDKCLDGTTAISPNLTSFKVGGTTITVTGAQLNSVVNRVDEATAEFTGSIQEAEHTVSDGAAVTLDPSNGTLQTWTLGNNRTPGISMNDGQYLLLRIDDGSGRTIDWSTIGVVWMNGVEPTLVTSGYTFIQLWKMGGTVYGSLVGEAA